MKGVGSSNKKFRPASVSRVRRSSISSSSKQIQNENQSHQPPSESFPIIINEYNGDVRAANVGEVEQENSKGQRHKYQSKSARGGRDTKFLPRGVTRVERCSSRNLPKRMRSGNFLSSEIGDEQHHGGSEHIHVKDLNLSDSVTNEHTGVISNSWVATRNSPSFSSMKNTNKKEEDQSKSNKETRPVSVTRIKRTLIHSPLNQSNSFIEHGQIEDLTPLDPVIQLKSKFQSRNTDAVKYHFQSSPLMTTISGKQQKRVKNLYKCQGTDYFKVLGCILAMAATSLGIAAMIFALLANRNSLFHH